MPTPPKPPFSIDSLLQITSALLGPNGCPWDKAQTHKSLIKYCIEEAFEFAEATENEDFPHMKEELGDLLFQVALHAEMANKDKQFNFEEVVYNICEKMIRRHPHVFSDEGQKEIDQVIEDWDKIKQSERDKPKPLFDIPVHLPSLMTSQKIGQETKKLNFHWQNSSDVFNKVTEEYNELKTALSSDNKEHIKEELGDLLFTLAQLGCQLDLDTEQVLRQANSKFKSRFHKMLKKQNLTPQQFKALSPHQKESLWTSIK